MPRPLSRISRIVNKLVERAIGLIYEEMGILYNRIELDLRVHISSLDRAFEVLRLCKTRG